MTLRWSTRLGYGAAEFGLAAVEVFLQIYLLKFYHLAVGLPSAWAGVAIGLAVLWDAVSDPVMGGLSDRTRAVAGRRRPYLLPGALLLALAFAALFNPPGFTSSQTAAFLYLLAAYVALNTGMTLVGVPHAALGADLSEDRHERTRLFAARRFFAVIGVIAGTAMPAILLRLLGGDDASAVARGWGAWLLVLPIVGAVALTVRVTRGLDQPATDVETFSLRRLFLDQLGTFRNPLFRLLVIAFVVAAIGRTINASTALYYYEYRLGLSETEAIAALLLPFFLAFVASIPGWVWLSRRRGKRDPAVAGVVLLGASTFFVYPLFPPGELLWPVVYSVVGGALAGSIVLLDALVADTVDYDRLRSGRDREGLHFGVWRMSTKVARATGLVLAGVLLQAIGVDPEAGAVTADGLGWRLALLFGPLVGSLFVAAGILLACLPLTDALHERIQRLVRRRRAWRSRASRAR